MTSLPATPPTPNPDRVFGLLDQDLAHRAAQLPHARKPVEPFTLPPSARDAAPSYCEWPLSLTGNSSTSA